MQCGAQRGGPSFLPFNYPPEIIVLLRLMADALNSEWQLLPSRRNVALVIATTSTITSLVFVAVV